MSFNKKFALVLICALLPLCSVFSQTITKFAVVDTSRVFSTYYRDSSAVRNYEAKKAEFQKIVTTKTEELQTLNQKMIDAKEAGDNINAAKFEAEIIKKADYLTEYTNTKNIELDSIKKKLEKSDGFYAKLYDVLGQIAESDGYSMILSLQQANTILWYSPSVDITDKVIKRIASY